MRKTCLQELVSSRSTLDRFLGMMSDLKENEVMYISLSSRSKYLTPAMKDAGLRIGRNEMFHRAWFASDIGSEITKYLDKIQCVPSRYGDVDYIGLKHFVTRSGHNIPLDTVVVYVNINPSNTLMAYGNLQEKFNRGLMDIALTGKSSLDFNRMKSYMDTEVQKARSRRVFIDIDMDNCSIGAASDLANRLPQPLIVETKGGYHLLLRPELLSRNKINLNEELEKIRSGYNNTEIIINSNAMIPLPGLYQAGHPVVFID